LNNKLPLQDWLAYFGTGHSPLRSNMESGNFYFLVSMNQLQPNYTALGNGPKGIHERLSLQQQKMLLFLNFIICDFKFKHIYV
jgi:hypothetical protein